MSRRSLINSRSGLRRQCLNSCVSDNFIHLILWYCHLLKATKTKLCKGKMLWHVSIRMFVLVPRVQITVIMEVTTAFSLSHCRGAWKRTWDGRSWWKRHRKLKTRWPQRTIYSALFCIQRDQTIMNPTPFGVDKVGFLFFCEWKMGNNLFVCLVLLDSAVIVLFQIYITRFCFKSMARYLPEAYENFFKKIRQLSKIRQLLRQAAFTMDLEFQLQHWFVYSLFQETIINRDIKFLFFLSKAQT